MIGNINFQLNASVTNFIYCSGEMEPVELNFPAMSTSCDTNEVARTIAASGNDAPFPIHNKFNALICPCCKYTTFGQIALTRALHALTTILRWTAINLNLNFLILLFSQISKNWLIFQKFGYCLMAIN